MLICLQCERERQASTCLVCEREAGQYLFAVWAREAGQYLFGIEEEEGLASEKFFTFWPLCQIHLILIQTGLVYLWKETINTYKQSFNNVEGIVRDLGN